MVSFVGGGGLVWFWVRGVKPTTSYMLSKFSTTELCPQPLGFQFKATVYLKLVLNVLRSPKTQDPAAFIS